MVDSQYLGSVCFAAYDMALADHYEENLVALIKALRLRYKAPNAKFVAATLGQTLQTDTTSTEGEWAPSASD
jgi:hypothetical protein